MRKGHPLAVIAAISLALIGAPPVAAECYTIDVVVDQYCQEWESCSTGRDTVTPSCYEGTDGSDGSYTTLEACNAGGWCEAQHTRLYDRNCSCAW